MKAMRILISMLVIFCGGIADIEAQEIYVSIPPLKYAVERLIEKGVGVVLAPGQNPHSYAPAAQQIATLAQAKILFTTGVPFERPLVERLRQVAPGLKIISTDRGLATRTFSEACDHAGHEHAPHDHGGVVGGEDPHVWMSPTLYMKQAEIMAAALIDLYPEQKRKIEENLGALQTSLKLLDQELENILKPLKGKQVLVYHPAFGYFCDAYGLKQQAVEMGGKEPTAAQLSLLMKTAQAEKIKVIFVQKQFPVSTANAMAQSIGGVVVPLDPLSGDYLNNLRDLAVKMLQVVPQSAK